MTARPVFDSAFTMVPAETSLRGLAERKRNVITAGGSDMRMREKISRRGFSLSGYLSGTFAVTRSVKAGEGS